MHVSSTLIHTHIKLEFTKEYQGLKIFGLNCYAQHKLPFREAKNNSDR